MIRKLQRKFVLIAMLSAFSVVFAIMLSLNLLYIYQTNVEVRSTLDTLAENNGQFPDKLDKIIAGIFGVDVASPETPYKTRYFVVQTDVAGNVRYISLDNIAAITMKDALSLSYNALDKGSAYGTDGIYKYVISEKYYGKLLIFVDCREQLEMRSFLLISSGVLMVSVLCVLFALIYFFSKRAMKPVAESYEKQKQFITDAGHEIKTPLAIISASTDVLEMCGESNEWIDSIKNQTKRLDKLVKNLITLSRMDEEKPKVEFKVFSISDAVIESAESFEAPAQAQNKRFELNIQPGLAYNGDEGGIRQLVSILCDNAIKYSDDGGYICVTLAKRGKNVILDVFNTCDGIQTDNLDKLFDRFYRADASRSRQTGGFGIGLSIAKATVQAHKGKITAASSDGKSVNFTAVL